jgi:hypothetical protein
VPNVKKKRYYKVKRKLSKQMDLETQELHCLPKRYEKTLIEIRTNGCKESPQPRTHILLWWRYLLELLCNPKEKKDIACQYLCCY